MLKENMDNLAKLHQLLEKNLPFHVLLEREVEETPFGQITFNFEIKEGEVVLSTLNIVRNRRYRYKGDKNTDDVV
jgi:hypothetical protein